LTEVVSNGKLVKNLTIGRQTFNNQADLYLYYGKNYVIRKIGHQYNLSGSQLIKLEEEILRYYKLLKKCFTLKLPKVFLIKIDNNHNIVVLMTEYFSGGSVTEVSSAAGRSRYFKKILLAIIRLVTSKNNLDSRKKLIYSIDPNPNNFLLNKKGVIFYNDFTPPLFRKNGSWLEFRRIDEVHAKKSDKEKRYFTGINLLLAFVNKTRIYLPFADYLKLLKWLSIKIQSLPFTDSSLVKFTKIYKKLISGEKIKLSDFNKQIVSRDLLRFILTFRGDLTVGQIKKLYKQSKQSDGVDILINKVYEKN